jgi:hypothetical protein
VKQETLDEKEILKVTGLSPDSLLETKTNNSKKTCCSKLDVKETTKQVWMKQKKIYPVLGCRDARCAAHIDAIEVSEERRWKIISIWVVRWAP